jgi:hypothetical protein
VTRVPAIYTMDGIFTRKCPRGKLRCYNGNGIWCQDMSAHNGEPGKSGPVTVLCSAPTKKGKS